MAGWLLLAALGVGLLGLWLWWRAGSARRATGLPGGQITYVDTGAWDRCERPLFSRRHRLTGRPDYLVRTPDGVIPVEVKSGPAPRQPYPAHVLQLAAYCLLVAEQEGRAPSHGILKYATSAFEIPYSPEVETQVLDVIQAMRHDLDAADVAPNHDDPRRCRGCGYRGDCDHKVD